MILPLSLILLHHQGEGGRIIMNCLCILSKTELNEYIPIPLIPSQKKGPAYEN